MSRTLMSEARKQDTRQKIEMGGLIVKAGLRNEKPALLLGLLLDARRRLNEDETERSRLETIGAEAWVHGSE
ncbi:conjugal transfer protein TraD [Aminobacter sp. AP02]|uniref:conjugal transfer protein TraD n=1 Tax=Aminobacter sp. AP02 TaxID=2135737 RepID=UPI000D6B42CA|nr:conjugal transfer protein TraD [Aminobacter sp. AP02]